MNRTKTKSNMCIMIFILTIMMCMVSMGCSENKAVYAEDADDRDEEFSAREGIVRRFTGDLKVSTFNSTRFTLSDDMRKTFDSMLVKAYNEKYRNFK